MNNTAGGKGHLFLQIHPNDNVLVALQNLSKGHDIVSAGKTFQLSTDVSSKHKFTLEALSPDDKIFMYLEDADLTRRFLKISQTAYFPEAHVYHHFAKLTHKKIKFKWITVQSAFIYFNKWGWLKSLY